MKKNFIYILAFLITSCSVSEMPDTLIQKGMTIVASSSDFQEVKTKTIIGSEVNSGDVVMLWEPSEIIGVYGKTDDVNVMYKSTNTSLASTANFTSSEASETPIYAYYPYVAGNHPATAVPFDISENQSFTSLSSLQSCDIKVAEMIETLPGGFFRMKFKQKASLIKLSLDLSSVSGLNPGEKIIALDVIADNPNNMEEHIPFAGNFVMDITNPSSQFEPRSGSGCITINTLTFSFESSPVVPSEPVEYYAIVAPGQHKGKQWCCVLMTDQERLLEFFSQPQCDLLPGYSYILPINATVIESSYHYEYPDPDSDEGIRVDGPAFYGPDGPIL